MPTNYTGRVILILTVLIVAIICIFPPQSLFQPGLSLRERTNLKPGIDMVGGVSLIYKIKQPEGRGGNSQGASLAEQVMEALKKRVDPDGVRNLVWRPIGSDELEIQMPLTPHSEDAPKKREAYTNALNALAATNIRQSEVLDAVNMPAGPERDRRLSDLAMGDPARQGLFTSLADMATQLGAAKKVAADAGNAPAALNPPTTLPALALPTTVPTTQQATAMAQQAAGAATQALGAASRPAVSDADVRNAVRVLDEVGEKFNDAKTHIEDDNIVPQDVQAILEGVKTDPAKFNPKLEDLKKKYANFPRRAAAVSDFEKKFTDYEAVRSSLDDASDLKRLLKGSGVLEFHILAWDTSDSKYREMYDRMKPGGKGPAAQANDDYRWFQVDRPEEFDKPGFPPRTLEWNDKHYMLGLITPETSMVKTPENPWALERATPSSDDTGGKAVGFQFDTNGGHLFSELSTRWKPNNGRDYSLAIVLDNKIISAPRINGPITGGSGIITGGGEGGFTQADFEYLINTLNAGSLPATLEDEPISERRVGSTLGADNLHKGLLACGFGLVVVGVFLIGYYYLAGVVAFTAVLFNLLIILGVMAAFNATFTLPSIAGIVLTVGTAVDANVLIFERLREEQHQGLGLRMALRNSYDRAFSAIIDSNMTSLITSVFLYWFGSEEVKGFGLTLIIGIVASLFTALFVTKTIFGLLIDYGGVKDLGSFPLSFPKWDKLLKPSIDWMGLAWVFYTFSAVAVTTGVILFAYYAKQGKVMDIEFAAGTSVEFELKRPMPIGEVRKVIEGADRSAIPAPTVVAVGTDNTAYEVVTPSIYAVTVRKAVVEALGSNLKTQLPSKFEGVDARDVGDAMARRVAFPVPADLKLWPGGNAPAAARDFTGGVAIRLNDLNPPISANEIKARIDRDRPQTPGEEKLTSVQVVSPAGDDTPTTTATVLVANPALAYSPEHQGQWEQDLATPAWNLVSGAVNHEAALRKVNSFNPSVAGDTRRDALVALTLSILVIMAYIWVRFGNLKYGTATVVALLHDTVFTIAALGFAHLLADTTIGRWLQLEPFRINLTVVAGILTIMGYSMIDTIVVFDRIRENRGKFGHLSRQVINDAINQTLSRTLLTAGTTTVTVAFMYFMGGSGIHGFTFVLLVGILVGTYSSVAIAAPILLLNAEAERRSAVANPPYGQLSRAV